jgi:aspartate/methionine/tyrosine aminotransferase
MPAPIQGAVAATLAEDQHVQEQRGRYRARRELIFPALRAAGFRIDHSEGGLYAWASRDEECWSSVSWFSERGILVAPGSFYGEAGQHHIRVALTATDAACEAAASRLRA